MQLSLDHLIAEAEANKQEAIDTALYNADGHWYAAAKQIVEDLAKTGDVFSTDAVWSRLEARGLRTHDNRAMGGIIRDAVKSRTIIPTGQYVPSMRKVNHRRPIMTYRGSHV